MTDTHPRTEDRRQAVKLLLLDQDDRALLIHAVDPRTGYECWYPVGGGVEPGETIQQAAAREAHEESGLTEPPPGETIWTRDHTYHFNGETTLVHEDWLLVRVDHFEPTPTSLTESEAASIRGFRWWTAQELSQTTDTVFPPNLGPLLAGLLRDGTPEAPVDITDAAPQPETLDGTTAPRAGLLFEHCIHTTGYQRADGPEPVTYEITDVTADGKVHYGPAQRGGIPTIARYWIRERDFHRDALGTYVGDRGQDRGRNGGAGS